jgi:hypothetical protein
MNLLRAQLIFISELGLRADIFIEFNQNSNQTTEQIEELAISLGYHQLITDGFNLSPDEQDNLIFEKIISLKMA